MFRNIEKITQEWIPTQTPPGYNTIREHGCGRRILDDEKKHIAIKLFEKTIQENIFEP
jgi:hypothetical protein